MMTMQTTVISGQVERLEYRDGGYSLQKVEKMPMTLV